LKILFRNAKILDLTKEKGYFCGSVVVEEDLITYVGEKEPRMAVDKVIDVQGNILMPGFVNAHAHTPMTLLRGAKDDCCLDTWLNEGVWPLEAKMTNEDVYWGQMLGIAEYVRAGITTFDDFYFHYDGMCRAINKAGIRARFCVAVSISSPPNANFDKELEDNYELVKKLTNPKLVNIVATAHAIYTISEEKFFALLKFANKNNLSLSLHLSETLKEVGDCTQKNNGLTPPAYIEQLGMLDRPCLCYHCVHMDKDDLQILADYNASVATCPSSNLKLASGIAPIYAMQNKGLNIAIGTDGAASNNSLDMFKEMFLVATLSKVNIYDASVVSARQVLQMATVNGAKALDINSGEIKVGKNADIILVSLQEPHMQPQDNIISNLVYSAKSSDVYFTMVGGKVLYENGKYNIGEDIETIYKKAEDIRKRLMS